MRSRIGASVALAAIMLSAACSGPPMTIAGAATSTSSVDAESNPPQTAEPVGTGYLAAGPGWVAFIEWHKQGTSLTGTAQFDQAAGTAPAERVSAQTVDVDGQLSGPQISLSFDSETAQFGTFSGSSFTLNVPQSDGSLLPETFHKATAAEFNQAVSTLQEQVNKTNVQASQAATVQHDQAVIDRDVKAVGDDINRLDQDASAVAASVGVFSKDLETEKADLATTAKDEQKVLTEASNSSSGDNTCYDAQDVVGYDAQDVVEYDTEDVIGYDAGQVEGAVTSVRNDITALRSDFAQLQKDAVVLPSYQPNAPTGAEVDQAIASASKAVSSAVTGANAAIDQANAYTAAAFQYAAVAYRAGNCGSPPSTPEPEKHIG